MASPVYDKVLYTTGKGYTASSVTDKVVYTTGLFYTAIVCWLLNVPATG